MYTIELINERHVWETFLQTLKPHSFLQSWNWGEVNRESGAKILRIGIRENGALVAAALMIHVPARRGSFMLIPHGPLVLPSPHADDTTRALLAYAENIARKEHCAFLRVCPMAEHTSENRAFYRSLGFRDAPIHMHPELAWMLDIGKPEDELLRDMRKTTRYLIKKLDTEGVEIVQSTNPADLQHFWPVYEATAKRQRFTTFGKKDVQKEFELFANGQGAMLFLGKLNGAVVAAAIIIFYNGQAFYHHSGSLSEASGSNVSYLLQWRVIQEAKRRGCTLYNFWGIAPHDKKRHPWAGLSQFKKGFGGFDEQYVHAQDLPLTWKYATNFVVETTRRIKRGF